MNLQRLSVHDAVASSTEIGETASVYRRCRTWRRTSADDSRSAAAVYGVDDGSAARSLTVVRRSCRLAAFLEGPPFSGPAFSAPPLVVLSYVVNDNTVRCRTATVPTVTQLHGSMITEAVYTRQDK